MQNKIYLLLFTLLVCSSILQAQSVQKGPYTISVIIDGVYHIEDANESNPAGVHLDKDGLATGQNNCSDMYLIVGDKNALLIDLSNAIAWDNTATESLRSIVYGMSGKKKLYITVTHKHGDHLGMLPAFANDPEAQFWLPKAELEEVEGFPTNRTSYFTENESFDLGGGVIVNTLEVPGHTDHSTLFFLKNKNIVFTGDAIGSGSGVWLFNYESFLTYIKGIDGLIKYIENPSNNIDLEKLTIYGGHSWQRGKLDKLTAQYIFDMKTLIEKIGEGSAETEGMSAFISFLNTNFKYGTATITWNEEAASRYRESIHNQ